MNAAGVCEPFRVTDPGPALPDSAWARIRTRSRRGRRRLPPAACPRRVDVHAGLGHCPSSSSPLPMRMAVAFCFTGISTSDFPALGKPSQVRSASPEGTPFQGRGSSAERLVRTPIAYDGVWGNGAGGPAHPRSNDPELIPRPVRKPREITYGRVLPEASRPSLRRHAMRRSMVLVLALTLGLTLLIVQGAQATGTRVGRAGAPAAVTPSFLVPSQTDAKGVLPRDLATGDF